MKTRSMIEILDLDNYEKIEPFKYERLIGKPIYLICGTRPNIAFSVEQLKKYIINLKEYHFKAAKKVV